MRSRQQVAVQTGGALLDAPDDSIATMFHDTFRGPVDSPTREAQRELVFSAAA